MPDGLVARYGFERDGIQRIGTKEMAAEYIRTYQISVYRPNEGIEGEWQARGDVKTDTVPPSVPAYAFSGLHYITSVDIPPGVGFVGHYAFKNCRSLERLAIPEGVKFLMKGALEGIPLRTLVLPASLASMQLAIGGNVETVVCLGDTPPKGLMHSLFKKVLTFCASKRCMEAIVEEKDKFVAQLATTGSASIAASIELRAQFRELDPARARLYASGLWHPSLHHELDGVTRAWFEDVGRTLLCRLPKLAVDAVLTSLLINARLHRAD